MCESEGHCVELETFYFWPIPITVFLSCPKKSWVMKFPQVSTTCKYVSWKQESYSVHFQTQMSFPSDSNNHLEDLEFKLL